MLTAAADVEDRVDALIEAADPAVTEGRRSVLAAAATARTPELPSLVLPRRAGSLVVGY
jgi:hypothetical protein